MALKAKPFTGKELLERIAPEVAGLPPTSMPVAAPPPAAAPEGEAEARRPRGRPPGSSKPPRATPEGEPLEQMNYRCSKELARALLVAADEAGGMRRLIALMAKHYGIRVPLYDMEKVAKTRQI